METPNLPAIRALRPAWNKGRIVGQSRRSTLAHRGHQHIGDCAHSGGVFQIGMDHHPDGSRFGLFAGHANQFLAGFRHHTWQQGHPEACSGSCELVVKIPRSSGRSPANSSSQRFIKSYEALSRWGLPGDLRCRVEREFDRTDAPDDVLPALRLDHPHCQIGLTTVERGDLRIGGKHDLQIGMIGAQIAHRRDNDLADQHERCGQPHAPGQRALRGMCKAFDPLCALFHIAGNRSDFFAFLGQGVERASRRTRVRPNHIFLIVPHERRLFRGFG